jgi:hypothetical protein
MELGFSVRGRCIRSQASSVGHVEVGSLGTWTGGLDLSSRELDRRFEELLRVGSRELFDDYPHRMATGDLLKTPNKIHDDDLDLFFRGIEHGHITLRRGARFDTRDRPRPDGKGRWGLLSRGKQGGWYNAEYLPQVAAYVDAIDNLGFHHHRVLFELPDAALKLDLTVLNNAGSVVVLGEAKRDVGMLDALLSRVTDRHASSNPGPKGRDEPQQLAWRLWTTRAPYLWLIGPGERRAYSVHYEPLSFVPLHRLPSASELGLAKAPGVMMSPPRLSSSDMGH